MSILRGCFRNFHGEGHNQCSTIVCFGGGLGDWGEGKHYNICCKVLLSLLQ